MSPGARQAKIGLLESMLNASSSALVAMASQLSEAEERERAFSSRARWQHVRSMADAKSLLQYILNSAVEARYISNLLLCIIIKTGRYSL